MKLLSEKIFDESMEIMRGKILPNMLLMEFRKWAKERLDINVVTIDFGKVNGEDFYSLNVVVVCKADIDKLKNGYTYDKEVISETKNAFMKIYTKTENKLLKADCKINVLFTNLSYEIRANIIKQASDELMKVKDLLGNETIYNVYIEFDEVHIFYFTEEDIKKNELNFVSEKINDYCRRIVEKYDEFNVFDGEFQCTFVSHEMLEQKFRNNMFSYTKEQKKRGEYDNSFIR